MDLIEIDDTELVTWSVTSRHNLDKFVLHTKKDLPFERIPTDLLYHYTDAKGLEGILESKSIWLTEIRYFNDALELHYAQDLIREVLNELNLDPNLADYFEHITKYFNPFEHHFYAYIGCFSEKVLLNQFRNYGSYCIGIKTTNKIRAKFNLIRPAPWQPAVFRKVIYDRDVQRGIVENLIRKTSKQFVQIIDNENITSPTLRNNVIQEVSNCLNGLLVESLLSFKHNAFEEEQEWRMIYSEIKDVNPRRSKFRVKSNHFVPYVEMPIIRVDDSAVKSFERMHKENKGYLTENELTEYYESHLEFPIDEIHIGPIEHKGLVKESVEQVLKFKNLDRVRVFSSDLLIREGW